MSDAHAATVCGPRWGRCTECMIAKFLVEYILPFLAWYTLWHIADSALMIVNLK